MIEKEKICIANCSGFYGDRLSAAREMVEGGPIDVLTGDYLAELTMAILHNKRMQDPNAGYVGTFLRQVREVIDLCLERNIKIVTNAGGLNPKGCAEAVEAIIDELGLKATVAYIEGDDLIPRIGELRANGESMAHLETGVEFGGADCTCLTANAYLGAWGIKEALDQGADVVICPRVTDAAIVVGPAAWKFNWKRNDFDALAGALVAGHVIECGTQVTGGNYAFFQEVPSFLNMGFPIAEIEPSGNFTITKHPGTGGLVSVGTVTAQLLYEISTPAYLNPDVVAHFDTISIKQTGPDRVYISGCKGNNPPAMHKVCTYIDSGFRNSIEMLLTGLDIEEKAKIYTEELFRSVGGREQFDKITEQLLRTDKNNPNTNDEAFAVLRIVVESKDPQKVGRLFSAKATELGLASYPGLFGRAPAIPNGPILRHWPTLINSKHIVERVHINGKTVDILPTSQLHLEKVEYTLEPVSVPPAPAENTTGIHFGRLFGTRSGDKGGGANLGVWAIKDLDYAFLYHYLTVEQLKILLPDIHRFKIDRYELPNLKALNFYIHGILGDGISASTRTDGQAKSLGEYLRAKIIEVPEELACRLSLVQKSY